MDVTELTKHIMETEGLNWHDAHEAALERLAPDEFKRAKPAGMDWGIFYKTL